METFLTHSFAPFAPLFLWGFFSIMYFLRFCLSRRKKSNRLLYSLPNGFTVTGVLGTFIGIYAGLQSFDTVEIESSIPALLEGLKDAFITSIIGIILSLIAGVIIRLSDKSSPTKSAELLQMEFLTSSTQDLATANKEHHTELAEILRLQPRQLAEGLSNSVLTTISKDLSEWQLASSKIQFKLSQLVAQLVKNSDPTQHNVWRTGIESKMQIIADNQSEGLREIKQNIEFSRQSAAETGESISIELKKNQNTITESNKTLNEQIQQSLDLNRQSATKTGESISSELKETQNTITESNKTLNDQIQQSLNLNRQSATKTGESIRIELENTQKAITENNKTLNEQIQQSLELNRQSATKTGESIRIELENTQKAITESNKELGQKIAEMNTKELLTAMETSVELFNSKMQEILERLVAENFNALNESVQKLNAWQIANRQNMDQLQQNQTNLLKEERKMIVDYEKGIQSIRNHLSEVTVELTAIKDTNRQLVEDNGRLQKIVRELESIALGENHFKKIIDSSSNQVEKLNIATEQLSSGMEQGKHLTQKLFEALDTSSSQHFIWQEKFQENAELFHENQKNLLREEEQMVARYNEGVSSLVNQIQNTANVLDNLRNTHEELLSDNGRLQKIVRELESIVLGDNYFKQIIDNSAQQIEKLNTATENFSSGLEQTHQLTNSFFRVQQTLLEVIQELRGVQEIGEIDNRYWQRLKENMGEILTTINQITNQIDSIDEQFKENLNNTFQSLDTIMLGYLTRGNDGR